MIESSIGDECNCRYWKDANSYIAQGLDTCEYFETVEYSKYTECYQDTTLSSPIWKLKQTTYYNADCSHIQTDIGSIKYYSDGDRIPNDNPDDVIANVTFNCESNTKCTLAAIDDVGNGGFSSSCSKDNDDYTEHHTNRVVDCPFKQYINSTEYIMVDNKCIDAVNASTVSYIAPQTDIPNASYSFDTWPKDNGKSACLSQDGYLSNQYFVVTCNYQEPDRYIQSSDTESNDTESKAVYSLSKEKCGMIFIFVLSVLVINVF